MYWPWAPAMRPMSSPPASCVQLAAEKPAALQVTGVMETIRGDMPEAPSILAAILFGRAVITAARNSGVSMKELTVSALLLRRPS